MATSLFVAVIGGLNDLTSGDMQGLKVLAAKIGQRFGISPDLFQWDDQTVADRAESSGADTTVMVAFSMGCDCALRASAKLLRVDYLGLIESVPYDAGQFAGVQLMIPPSVKSCHAWRRQLVIIPPWSQFPQPVDSAMTQCQTTIVPGGNHWNPPHEKNIHDAILTDIDQALKSRQESIKETRMGTLTS